MTQGSESQQDILANIATCVQTGKADASMNIPFGSQGQPGVAEWVDQAIAKDVSPQTIVADGLMAGLQVIGKKFANNEVFIPEVLIAARAMHAGMNKLKPLFVEQNMPVRGVFVMGTVQGDLHDIGKNLVCMLLEGAGWQIVDLGVDCAPEKFVTAIKEHPDCAIGLSALLTTTMVAMGKAVAAIRESFPDKVVIVGGAPVTDAFAKEIGASGYAADPSAAIDLLDKLLPAA